MGVRNPSQPPLGTINKLKEEISVAHMRANARHFSTLMEPTRVHQCTLFDGTNIQHSQWVKLGKTKTTIKVHIVRPNVACGHVVKYKA